MRSPSSEHLQADKISYVWDALIEQFSKHALAGTQYHSSHSELNEQGEGLRFLDQESRLSRRMLGAALIDLIETTPRIVTGCVRSVSQIAGLASQLRERWKRPS